LNPQWSRSINRINDAVYKGLANFTFTGLWNNEENEVARAIRVLKTKTNPANGVALSTRRNPSIGTDLIELDGYESCQQFLNNNYGMSYGSCVKAIDAANEYKRLLNDPNKGLEKASLQFLYNWVTAADLNNEELPFENRYKMRQHKEHVFELERLTGLSSLNIAGWLHLGIMRRTALKVGEVMTPEDLIQFLKDNLDTPILDVNDPRGEQIGSVVLIIAIAVLVLASFIGVSGLIQVAQGKEPTAFKYISQLSTLTNSPGGSDFVKKITDILPNGGGSTGTTCPTGSTKNAAGACVPNATTNTSSGFEFSLDNPLVIGGGAVALATGIYFLTK